MRQMPNAQRLYERLIYHCHEYLKKRGFSIKPESLGTLNSWVKRSIKHTSIEDIENVDFVEYAESLMKTLVSLAILDAKINNSYHIENENFEKAINLLGPIWPFILKKKKKSNYSGQSQHPNERDLGENDYLEDDEYLIEAEDDFIIIREIIRSHDMEELKKFSNEDIDKFLRENTDKLSEGELNFLNEFLKYTGITRNE